jgi:DNA replication protein DnaC
MNTDDEIQVRLQRMLESSKRMDAEMMAFVNSQPPTKPCQKHPEHIRAIDMERTREKTRDNRGVHTAGYTVCPSCQSEWTESEARRKLHASGVPKVLLHATLDNWVPATEDERKFVDCVREFTTKRVGFLLLLGAIGTGKSHLSVGAMRHFKNSLLIRQNELLRRLRLTYRDHNQEDPIEVCQSVGLLVLDEIGLSGGGKDELPMLHEILDHRHGEMKPTIITGNVNWEDMASIIGERLADRLKESAFRIVTLAGKSKRPEFRQRYFDSSFGEDLPSLDWQKTGGNCL